MQILFYAVWAILLAVFQPTLARGIAVWNIAPNLFLCFVVLAGIFRGKKEGAVCGAVFGLIYDIIVGRMIGVQSLFYLYLGFGAGWLSEQFFSGGKRIGGVVIIFVGTILTSLLYYFARLTVQSEISFITAFFRIGFMEALYNAPIGFVISFPLQWLMKLFRMEQIS